MSKFEQRVVITHPGEEWRRGGVRRLKIRVDFQQDGRRQRRLFVGERLSLQDVGEGLVPEGRAIVSAREFSSR